MINSELNLGNKLEEKRKQLGFTLQEVAEQTRIRKVYLESIEKGQLDDLPGQVYVTGFIRCYARHLGLDSDELLSRLDTCEEIDAAKDFDSVSPGSPVKVETQGKSGLGWGAFILGFILVLVLGSLFYFIL